MNLLDLTPQQLKRAAAIKEQIESLSSELSRLLGGAAQPTDSSSTRRNLSAAARKNIAAAQQARWAKFRARKKSAGTVKSRAKKKTEPVKSRAKKKTMSSAAKSKLSARMKAYWAAKKSAKK